MLASKKLVMPTLMSCLSDGAPVPELVLHDRAAGLDRVDADLLQRIAGQEAVGAGVEQLLGDVLRPASLSFS